MTDKASKIIGLMISLAFTAFNIYMVATGAGILNWIMLGVFALLGSYEAIDLVQTCRQKSIA